MSSRSLWSRGREAPWRMPRPLGIAIPHFVALVVALGVGGCATLPDGGMAVPTALAKSELHKDVVARRTDGDEAEARIKVGRLTRGTLNAEGAVQIALLNNRGLQSRLQRTRGSGRRPIPAVIAAQSLDIVF